MFRICLYSLLSLTFLACQQKQSKLQFEIKQVKQFEGSSIRGLSIAQDKSIWLSGSRGLVAVSMDEGQNWTRLTVPDKDSLDFRSIQAFSKNEAVIASAGYPCRIYTTVDHGSSWRLAYENKDSSAFINTISFQEEGFGLAFGDVLNGRHLLLKSTDGGESWMRIDSNQVEKPKSGENGFAASNACLAYGSDKILIALGGKQVRMLISNDMGESWQFQNTPMSTSSDYGGIYAIAHGNSRFVAVGGDFSQADSMTEALISKDALNWTLSDGTLSGYRSTVDYCSALDLWLAGGTNGLDLSQDNGRNWRKIDKTNINTLRFLQEKKIAIAADSKGNVFRITL